MTCFPTSSQMSGRLVLNDVSGFVRVEICRNTLNTLSSEQFSIKRAVVNGFRDVVHLDFFFAFQIHNRSTHFQYSIIASSRKIELSNRRLE